MAPIEKEVDVICDGTGVENASTRPQKKQILAATIVSSGKLQLIRILVCSYVVVGNKLIFVNCNIKFRV